ncbi:hypothetical protein E3U23_06900 [Erythrobacter litoralis]|nr:hypothetical protein [Erythrobacter litoralis]
MTLRMAVVLAAPALVACQGSSPRKEPTFSAIASDEPVFFTGTEPFWSGEAAAGRATWITPDNMGGTEFAVSRFAGNNGVSFSGELDSKQFDMMVTPGACSDQMSDRTYPYVATATIGNSRYHGCAWTERQPFSGPQAP